MAEFPGGWGIFIILWGYIPLFNAKITKFVKTNFGVFFTSQLLKVFDKIVHCRKYRKIF